MVFVGGPLYWIASGPAAQPEKGSQLRRFGSAMQASTISIERRMDKHTSDEFRFGIEAEFILTDAASSRPLWYRDLRFQTLNDVFESISLDGMPPLGGLALEPPHRKLMPFSVEGYHVPAPGNRAVDILPKGIEIRTPICSTISECLTCLKCLYDRVESALFNSGYRLASLSHHPTEFEFEAPCHGRPPVRCKWAKLAMTTYGPDISVSLPPNLNARLNVEDLHAKVNCYAPAVIALTLASPLYKGDLWRIAGQVGKSIRTHHRSAIAPTLRVLPQQHGRLEFKSFEATNRIDDFHAYLLLWLTILLDDGLVGRASEPSRIDDMRAVSRDGLETVGIRQRAEEVVERASAVLPRYGFDPTPLHNFRERLNTGQLPCDEITACFRDTGSLADVLRYRSGLVCASKGSHR